MLCCRTFACDSLMSHSSSIDYKSLYEASKLQVEELQGQIMELSHQLAQLKKMIFGSRSERYIPSSPGVIQHTLFNQDAIAETLVVETQKISYEKKKVIATEPKEHPGRMKLPAHLRRETTILEPEEDVSGCRKIGEEITEILECTVRPAKVDVFQWETVPPG